MKKITTSLIILFILFGGCKKVENSTGVTPVTTIKKDKISGLVQKGPYINGTQIVMYVLDDKLAQTGKVFNTQITDNKGSFELISVELSSKYVQFTASGFYYNESLGAITSTQLSLNALSDVTDASSINVNILTHLEKRRVESLVKSGKTFAEAKKTAQQEIFGIFGIQIAQSAVSEKLDIATAGDANAILLAISLIIQGELSVGDMSELLATISADLEDDGVMSNTVVMAKLIANAKSLHLDSIRQNLIKRYQDLGVTASIPDFDKYINVFLVQSAQKPSAESKAATIILNHTATLNGIVNPNGAETTVTFEYGLTSSYSSSIVAKESFLYGDTARSVSADISSLDSLTTYHYRIKAENGKGITYSADSTFTTMKDAYESVTIGSQIWMSKNLNVSTYRNGDLIPKVTDAATWGSLTTGAYCYYNNDSATYAAIYGKLYNWYAVNDSRGLAPNGYHVPSNIEFDSLIKYLDFSVDISCSTCVLNTNAGGDLKELSTSHWSSPNVGATNSTGFNALPGGYRNFGGSSEFVELGYGGFFWSSTQFDIQNGFYRGLYSVNSQVFKNYFSKNSGFSIRCLKD